VSISVDDDDNVYAFSRSDNPVMIFDRKGNFLDGWGQGLFKRPHGIHIDHDRAVYCTDDGDHTVRKFTKEGKLLMTIGVSGEGAPDYSGLPFNRCTHSALSPEGDIYVSDGYRNARVHKYTPKGKLISSWGSSGVLPGEFNIAHNVCCDKDGWVYVADRENHRIQVFDGNGKYEMQWNNLHRPTWIYQHPRSRPSRFYVAENSTAQTINAGAPNIGPRISILTSEGKFVTRFNAQANPGGPPTPFAIPHALAVDSHGDVYIADLAQQGWSKRYPNLPEDPAFESLKKLVRVPG
jgi:DNA-binding beta-propeller fold protein YncE